MAVCGAGPALRGGCAGCLEVEEPQQGDFCIVRIREGTLAGCGQLFQDEEVVGVPYIYGVDLDDVLADELDDTQVAERCGCICLVAGLFGGSLASV